MATAGDTLENAKRTLSSQQSTCLEIESFEDGNDFSETLTCAKFEELNLDLFHKTIKPVEQVLTDKDAKKENIDKVRILLNGLVFGFLMSQIRLCS